MRTITGLLPLKNSFFFFLIKINGIYFIETSNFRTLYLFVPFNAFLLILGTNIAYFHLGVYLILMTLLVSAVRVQISRKLYKTATNLCITE